ncbi:kinase-like protein [Clavulina sp. PMI_390]|nr:kinase-like protein [Clavulina sp. PMI_390]
MVAYDFVELVHREALTHFLLHHPNILPFLGVYRQSSESPPLTVVPYIDGGSLQGLLDREKLINPDRFRNILLGIVEGLCYLHSLKPPVIHGDLHPGNVLIGDIPYLCDFGLSRVKHEVSRTRSRQNSGGLSRFMAPELADSPAERFRTTQESDIYSLSMLSFNIWTGEKPFAEIKLEWRVAVQVIQGQRPTRPVDPAPRIPLPQVAEALFWELLLNMWAHDPAERLGTVVVLERLKAMFQDAFFEEDNLLQSPMRESASHRQENQALKVEANGRQIPSKLLAKFGLDQSLLILSHVPRARAIDLLDRIHSYLQSQPQNSPEYEDVLQLLQDACSHSCCLPKSLTLSVISFDRRDVIARGGEVTVYRGQTQEVQVVVREVLPVLTDEEWLVHLEAITHSQMNHENILRFLGIYYEGNTSPPLIVVPFIERGSLDKLLVDLNLILDFKFFRRVLLGISRGVEYLHSRHPHVVHGDLHPGNVLIDSLSRAYLCDFGLSRIHHEVPRARTMLGDREGGKLRYMAPELVQDTVERFRTSRESDIFSLAMTFFSTWSRQSPFADKIDIEIPDLLALGGRPTRLRFAVIVPFLTESALWNLIVEMWIGDPILAKDGYDVAPEDPDWSSMAWVASSWKSTLRTNWAERWNAEDRHPRSNFTQADYFRPQLTPTFRMRNYSRSRTPPVPASWRDLENITAAIESEHLKLSSRIPTIYQPM